MKVQGYTAGLTSGQRLAIISGNTGSIRFNLFRAGAFVLGPATGSELGQTNSVPVNLDFERAERWQVGYYRSKVCLHLVFDRRGRGNLLTNTIRLTGPLTR